MFCFCFSLCVLLILTASCNCALMVIADNSQSTTTIVAETASISKSRSANSSSPEPITNISLTTTLNTSAAICRDLNVMEDINIYKISGTWYEFARRGYGTYIQNVQCLQMDITYMNGTATVSQTYAGNMSNIHYQRSYEYIVQYNTTNISDYSILSTTYNYLPVPTFKILDTDYVNYLIVCSYLPEWEQSAAAFAYFRDISITDNDVFLTLSEVAIKYADFEEMNLVYQGEGCRSKSIPLTLPMGNTNLKLFIFLALSVIYILMI